MNDILLFDLGRFVDYALSGVFINSLILNDMRNQQVKTVITGVRPVCGVIKGKSSTTYFANSDKSVVFIMTEGRGE